MESRGHCVGVSGSVQSLGRNRRNKICVPERKDTDTTRTQMRERDQRMWMKRVLARIDGTRNTRNEG